MSETCETRHHARAIDYNRKHHADALVAVRSGLSDAAAMADAVATDILAGGRKRPSAERVRQALVAKRVGDAIWQIWSEL